MSETPASPENCSTRAEPQPQSISDERLMLAFVQGSSEAFTELFRRYKQPVYGFFCRRVSNPANAEELTQETFVALLRAPARYEPRASSAPAFTRSASKPSALIAASHFSQRVPGPAQLCRSCEKG